VKSLKDNAVILFTRIPIIGKTKTRLQPFLTAEQCCLLHKAFLADIHKTLQQINSEFDLIVFYTPNGDIRELKGLLLSAVSFLPQLGNNLGEKMDNAIKDVLTLGYKKCLLIGSDIPQLESDTIIESFKMLDQSDIVICPTEDGGYYLIGSKCPCGEIFELDEFGTFSVFENTLDKLKSSDKSYAIGKTALDIDEPSDFKKLAKLLKSESADICVHTRQAIQNFSGQPPADGEAIYD